VRRLSPVSGDWHWTAEGLPFGTVPWLVPHSSSFGAFTRIFHPVSISTDGGGRHWRDLAGEAGLTWHSEFQFSSLPSTSEHGLAWLGDLGHPQLQILADLLSRANYDDCVLGLWEGEDWTMPINGAVGSPDQAGSTLRVGKKPAA
jgi:hypothetical protein